MTTESYEDDFKVGYKSPPQHSRFQPGRSGNPGGKQKAVRNLTATSNERSRFPSGLMSRERRGGCRHRKPPCCGCGRWR